MISDRNGLPTVISPIGDTPAAWAGIQPGDAIASVDDQSTHGANLMEVVRKIRGKPETTVKRTIVRGGKSPFEVSLIRKTRAAMIAQRRRLAASRQLSPHPSMAPERRGSC
jgi:carboxyl-terminal processing protease